MLTPTFAEAVKEAGFSCYLTIELCNGLITMFIGQSKSPSWNKSKWGFLLVIISI